MNIIGGQHHHDNHTVDYHYKLKEQPNEKPHKTAVIAYINRLLKAIHYLVMNRKLYDYQMSSHQSGVQSDIIQHPIQKNENERFS